MFNYKRITFSKFLMGAVAVVAMVSLLGYVVMSLWNFVLPAVLNVGQISFWQALALLALCKILFGGFKGGGGGRFNPQKRREYKEKWMNMSDEEKAKFKEEWRKRCS